MATDYIFNLGSGLKFTRRPNGIERMGKRLGIMRRAAWEAKAFIAKCPVRYTLGVHWPSLDFLLTHDKDPGPVILPIEKEVEELRAYRAGLKLQYDWTLIKLGSPAQRRTKLPRRIIFRQFNGEPFLIRRRQPAA